MKNLQSKRRLRKSPTSRPDHSLRRQMLLEQLESRTMLAANLDFGDAPDLGPGTGAGDYTTLPEYGGASHEVSGALFMGTRPDPDSSAQANAAADGDDHGTSGEDDENGVSNPGIQLTVTATSSPVISVLVTNTTGQDAQLSGWIDFNGDGVFDETERGGVDVNGDGVIDESERTGATIGFAEAMPVQLQFSEVVPVYHGATYARFRLGLADDIAAGSPTGAAGIGEVEDYPSQVTLPVRTSSPPLRRDTGITTYTRPDNDFGSSMTALGDLSGNGVVDIAVGAPGDDTGGTDRGAVHLHYRDKLGAFTQVGYITSGTVGLGELVDGDRFGSSVASVGDLDNNGFIDLLVGAPGDDSGGNSRGAAYVLYLGVQDGRIAVLQTTKFTSETPGMGGLSDGSGFGRVVASAGDINQDGFEDLAIVSDDGGQAVVHILFLDDDQSAIGSAVIQSGTSAIPGVADWGKKLVGLGDVNGDRVPDLAVSGQSTVDILLMTKQGGVHSSTRLGGAGYSFAFGSSLEAVGDVDGDGVPDLVVGDSSKSTLLLLNPDGSASRQISSVSGSGTVESLAVVADPTQIDGVELVELLDNGNDVELRGVTYSERILTSGGQDVVPYNTFRLSNGEDRSLASVGNLDGVGLSDLAAGIPGFDDYGLDAGAIQIALRTGFGDQQTTLIASNTGGMGPLSKYDRFGTALAEAGDLNGDGFEDLYVSAPGDSFNRGAIYSIHLNGEGLVENYQKLELVNPGIGFRELGNSIDVVGDINGDGVDDLVVSSLTADRTGNQVLFVLMDEDGAGGRLVRFQAPFNAGRRWGGEVAGVGDVNGDGIPDLAVSDPVFGRVDLVFMQQASQFIANYQSVVRLPSGDFQGFGSALASMGDMDGDGISELAVGATERAVVYFLQEDGSVERSVSFKPYVAPGSLERPVSSLAALRDSSADLSTELAVSYGDISIKQVSQSVWQETDSLHQPSRQFDNESFAKSVTSLGDLDGNGTVDFAVASNAMDAVHVYLTGHADSLLDPLPVTRITEISVEHVTGPAATVLRGGLDQPVPLQGRLANLGDLDGDGVTDLAVGGTLVFLNRDGSSHSAVSVDVGDSVSSVTALGDLDGDGVIDLAMGTPDWNYDGGVWGGVHVLLMNADGSVKRRTVIDRETPELADRDRMKGLGWAIAGVGDINRDGVPDLVSLAPGEQYPDPSFVYVMLLDQQGGVQSSYTVESQVSSSSPEPFDAAFIPRGDIDGDGNPDLTYLDRRGWRTIFFDSDGTVREEILKDSDADAGTALGDLNQDGVNDMLVARFGDFGTRELVVEFPRTSVSLVGDLGDAPDVDPGTAAFDYNTLRADDGPMHGVVGGLYLGETVSVDSAIDLTTAADSDDDDGLVHPERDLTVTGTPSFELLVTNENGREATLYGWLDANFDGVFDESERVSTDVFATGQSVVTVTFPELPAGLAGTTYARFRLSTDEAASVPTGIAQDGEVEDYRVTIDTSPLFVGAGDVFSLRAIEGAFRAGRAIAGIGDLDDNGVDDYAIGTSQGDALLILLMATEDIVGETIIHRSPNYDRWATFGVSVASLGDLDGDGVTDIAVGANRERNAAGGDVGAVHIIFLNTDGTEKSRTVITDGESGGPTLWNEDGFGASVAVVGDLNNDGVVDLAVGAENDSQHGSYAGAVHILFMNADGTVQSRSKIGNNFGGGPSLFGFTNFGISVAALGDWNGDGIPDIAVGADEEPFRGETVNHDDAGAVYLIMLNADGTAKEVMRLNRGSGIDVDEDDSFGYSIASVGDLDGNGVDDIAVGAALDEPERYSGSVHLVLLNDDGTVKDSVKIGDELNGGPDLGPTALFGGALATLPDRNNDGLPELAIGAWNAGTVYIASLTDVFRDFGDAHMLADADIEAAQTSVFDLHVDVNGFDSDSYRPIGDINDDGISDFGGTYSEPFQSGPWIYTRYGLVTMLMNADGTVGDIQQYVPELTWANYTGVHPEPIGDLDGDGVPDIALSYQPKEGHGVGEVHLLFMNIDGSVRESAIMHPQLIPGLRLETRDVFGTAVTSMGDLDQDGTLDLAISSVGRSSGEVYVMFMNPDGSVKDWHAFGYNAAAQRSRQRELRGDFGASLSNLGDLDGDGVPDLLVGAPKWPVSGQSVASGAAFVVFMKRDGDFHAYQRITYNEGLPLSEGNHFGSAVLNVGDLDGDDVTDIVVGMPRDIPIGSDTHLGAVQVILLNRDGMPKAYSEISSETGGGPASLDFGSSIFPFEDRDGNGMPELLVAGAGGPYVLGLAPATSEYPETDSIQPPTHESGAQLFLGSSLDFEPRLPPDSEASSDDLTVAVNDDDGLVDPQQLSAFLQGGDLTVDVRATNLESVDATLYGWVDLNGNRLFDLAERVSQSVPAGTVGEVYSLSFSVPASVAAGTTYARFRISTDPAAAAPTGPAWDGEVEDYSTAITIINSDYGDAPDIAANTGQGDYNTLSTDSGPSHLIDPRIYLGAIPNAEIDGKQSVAANGDLDDGLVDPDADLTLFPGEQPVVRVQATNTTNVAAQLYGWIDYNTDGVFQTDTALEESFVEVPAGYSGTVELVFPEVPEGAEGYSFARFRLSTDTAVSSPTGPAEDGEVEDYRVTILSNDYGDAPAGYNLTASDVFDPPSHQVLDGLSIGSIVDRELRGEYSDSATRDDIGGTAGVNDEDGLTSGAAFLSLTAGRAPEFEVDVTNVNGLPATLHVWLDLDFDGTFSSGEHREFDASQSGPIVVTGFPEIGGDVTGVTYARLRLSTDQAGDDLPTGHLTDGEVEDYRVSISNKDYGDAPDTGPTPGPGNYSTIDGRGPVHTIVSGLYLGSGVDGESDSVQLLPDGRQRLSANGDDQTGSDDEDGVVDPSASLRLTKGQVPTIVVRATNDVDPEGSDALVVGWIDFNQNGVFELHERAVSEKPIVPGAIDELIVLDFDAPADLVGTTYARFRISSDADVIDPNSVVDDGEVEDYVVTVSAIDYGPPPLTGDAVVASTNIYHLTEELRYKARIGTSVATGDLNGDGHADIVTRSDLGWYYDVLNVGLSDAEGAITDNLQIGREIILAAGYVSLFVIRDVAIGDVNGDGTPDIVLSTTTQYGSGWWSKNQHEIQVLYLDRADDGAVNIAGRWTISSDHPNVNLGETTVDGITIKDLNRDGIPDILFGQWVDGTYPESIQALYLENPTGTPAFGALSVRQSTVVTSPYSPPSYIPGWVKLSGDFGRYIAVGDFNSDSVPDVAVSTRSGRSAEIYHLEEVVGPGDQRSVRHNGESSVLLNPDTLGIEGVDDTWEINALDAYDFDRDGVDELVIGSHLDFGTGAVHAVSVMPNGEAETVFTLSNASDNIELAGQERFGTSVAVAGGDSSGQTEILVGTPMYGGTSPSGSKVTNSGAIFSIRLAVESLPETVAGDVNSLPDIPPPSGYQIQGEATDESIDDWFVAIETLPEFPRPNETVTITLDVTAGETDLSGLDIEVPSGYQLVLDSGDETVTFTGASPALTVTSGDVVLDGNFRFVNPTDTPTIRVLGGSLKLRGVEIQESTAGDQPAIEVIGGSVDLGSAADPGDNTININGAGSVIRHVGSTSIPAVGNVFTRGGAAFLDEFALEELIEDYFDDASRGVVQVDDDRYHAQRNLETSEFDLMRLIADLELDDPTFEVLAGNGGTGTLLPDGNTVRFQSDNLGESSFTFAVVDNQATAAIRTVNLNVTNFAPVVDLGADRDGNEGQTFAFDGQFTDPFGDPSDTSAYTFAWLVTNSVGEVVASADTQPFDFTPAEDGVYTVRYSVTDSYGVSDTDELILTAVEVADAPVVSSVEINGANLHDNTVQRSQVTSLLIQFDRPVDVAADAFQIVNLDSGESLAPEQILYTPGTADSFAVRFGDGPGVISGLAGAANTLADGNYQLTINPDGVSADGVPLEGDGPEGQFQFAFYRLAGDADGDRQVGQSDMNIVIAAQGSTPSSGNWDPNADLDGDGRVSVRDRFMVFLGLGNELLTVEQGGGVTNRFDTSGNGSVTSLDALRVINRLASAPAEGELVNAARPDQFDVNRDSRVSPIDALQIINHLAYVANLSPNASPAEGERPAIDALIGQGDVLHGELHDVELDDETLEVLATEQQAGLF